MAGHFNRLAKSSISALPLDTPLPRRVEVHERPLAVVVSSDLRNHPVGRFWLPIARQLQSRFRVIYVAGHPRDSDSIRTELKNFLTNGGPLMHLRFQVLHRESASSASLLLDLGGHT